MLFDFINEYVTLPPVSEIARLSATSYYENARGLVNFCIPEYLDNPMAAEYSKFGDWCKYISRFSTCTIAPHPSEFSGSTLSTNGVPYLTTNNSITTPIAHTTPSTSSASLDLSVEINASNIAGCYDDYFCEGSSNGSLFFMIYGVVFSLIYSSTFLFNVACIVGFNKSSNRCGATLYFSAVAVLDCIYMGIKLALKTSVHLSDVSYTGQEEAYAKWVAYFVPGAVPLLHFFEVVSVWLVVCLLAERYLYLRRGYFSKSGVSVQNHIRIIIVVLLLGFCYTTPRFFEFKSEKNADIPGGYRVVYTELGTFKVYRSLIDYLLNIPLEMFLPYLAVGLLTSLMVSKMVDLGSSKWKTITSLCSHSAYYCHGDDFANCCPTHRPLRKCSSNQADSLPMDSAGSVCSLPRSSVLEDSCSKPADETQVHYCGIPFEKRSDLMPFYFIVPPPRQTLKETANVVISVCLGFLLLITKIPQLILIALELEHYVKLDVTFTRMASECLNIMFLVLKPLIYLMLGVHFRHALTGLCCCACLYAPVIGESDLSTHEANNDNGEEGMEDFR